MSANDNKDTFSISMQVSQFVAQIYHQSQGGTEEDFKEWCSENLQKIISFDSFFWITNFNPAHFHNTSDSYSCNIGKDFFKNDESLALKQITEPILNKAIRLPNLPIAHSLSIEEQINLHHDSRCEQHSQKHGLITFCKSADNIHGHLIGFYRDSQKPLHTQQEIDLKIFILPHLVEAFHLNQLSQSPQRRKYPTSSLAVCDKQLNIIEAEEGFYSLLKINRDKKRLPIAMLEGALINKPNVSELKLDITESRERYFIEAYYYDPVLRSLTHKESCIVNLLRQGLSNKDILVSLKISTKTLNNHLSHIYEKFGLKSKNKILAYLLSPSARLCSTLLLSFL